MINIGDWPIARCPPINYDSLSAFIRREIQKAHDSKCRIVLRSDRRLLSKKNRRVIGRAIRRGRFDMRCYLCGTRV